VGGHFVGEIAIKMVSAEESSDAVEEAKVHGASFV
jgi:hypothetical protein